MPPQDAQTAFFSYSRADSEFALRLAGDLKLAGANGWLDQMDIKPGMQWDSEVQNALSACPIVLVILSPSSVKSPNVLDEISFALSKSKTVIPVLYRDCEIPFRLGRLHQIDFRSDYSEGLDKLLDSLGSALGSVPTHPQKHGARLLENRIKAFSQSRYFTLAGFGTLLLAMGIALSFALRSDYIKLSSAPTNKARAAENDGQQSGGDHRHFSTSLTVPAFQESRGQPLNCAGPSRCENLTVELPPGVTVSGVQVFAKDLDAPEFNPCKPVGDEQYLECGVGSQHLASLRFLRREPTQTRNADGKTLVTLPVTNWSPQPRMVRMVVTVE